jgi:hypothetical protein
MPDLRLIYITGRGGDANQGLGAYLKTLDANRIGLSINSQFLKLSHDEQVGVVSKLIGDFDSADTLIVANSYGAYLLVQAMLVLGSIKSQVILLSPVMGRGMLKSAMFMSRPPDEHKIIEAEERGAVLSGTRVAVHVGEHDDSVNICDISKRLGITNVTVVQKAGHNLPADYIQRIICPHFE